MLQQKITLTVIEIIYIVKNIKVLSQTVFKKRKRKREKNSRNSHLESNMTPGRSRSQRCMRVVNILITGDEGSSLRHYKYKLLCTFSYNASRYTPAQTYV